MDVVDLASQWRDEAAMLRRRGHESLAVTMESVAAELEEWWVQWQVESLTLEQAVEISGYSYSHLQDLVASGAIPNVGKKGSPRVLRKDLPRKPRPPRADGPQLVDRVLSGDWE